MKKIFLSIVVLAFASKVQSQTANPMPIINFDMNDFMAHQNQMHQQGRQAHMEHQEPHNIAANDAENEPIVGSPLLPLKLGLHPLGFGLHPFGLGIPGLRFSNFQAGHLGHLKFGNALLGSGNPMEANEGAQMNQQIAVPQQHQMQQHQMQQHQMQQHQQFDGQLGAPQQPQEFLHPFKWLHFANPDDNQLGQGAPEIDHILPIIHDSQIVQQQPPMMHQFHQIAQQAPQMMHQMVQQAPEMMHQIQQNVQQAPQMMHQMQHMVQQAPPMMHQMPPMIQEIPQMIHHIQQNVQQAPPMMLQQAPPMMHQMPQMMQEIPQMVHQVIQEAPRMINQMNPEHFQLAAPPMQAFEMQPVGPVQPQSFPIQNSPISQREMEEHAEAAARTWWGKGKGQDSYDSYDNYG